MYRPDRIGPWPLVTLEQLPEITTGAALVAGAVSPPPYVVFDAVPNDNAMAQMLEVSDDWSIGGGLGLAVGVKVSGRDVLSADGEYLLSCGGAMLANSQDADLSIAGIVGRCDAPGELSGTLPQYSLVPLQMGLDVRPGIVQRSCNMTVVLGDWDPDGEDLLTSDLFFGFFYVNHGADPGVLEDLRQHALIHRYLEDLHPFDPNR